MTGLRLAVLSVHTCPLAPLGGWETGGLNVYVREISRELAERGVQVDVFTRRQVEQLDEVVELAPGARVIHIDAGPPRALDKYDVLDYLSEFSCGVQRFRMLAGRRYDLVHAHYWLSMRPARQFQATWQVPFVAQFHTLAQLKNRVARDDAEREYQERVDLERMAVDQADCLIAQSPADRRQLTELYGACPHKVEIVPGGVDLDHFRPGSRRAARRALHLPHEAAVLLYVGRIQRLKGIEVLLYAAAELRTSAPGGRPLRVLIVGGQPDGAAPRPPERREIERLRALAGRLRLDEVVTFTGAVPQRTLPLYYRAADVTVMPSSYESFGLVALESMACGTPVVASSVGGLRSLVEDGRTGFLIPWRHPSLFAERIGQVLRQPALAARLGQAAVQRARQLSWAAAAERLLGIYAELLAASTARAQAEQPGLS